MRFNSQTNQMVKGETGKKIIFLKKATKKKLSYPKLTCLTQDIGYEIEITS